MLCKDWSLYGVTVAGIYKVSLDTNETLINNVIPKTLCLLGRGSCKIEAPGPGTGWASGSGRPWPEVRAHGTGVGQMSQGHPAPDHTCYTMLTVGFAFLLSGIRAPSAHLILYSSVYLTRTPRTAYL